LCGAEVAGRDHAQPQGGHDQNIECRLGSGYIGGQVAIRAVRSKVIAGTWAWLLAVSFMVTSVAPSHAGRN
jgi:hypothetical protein